MHKLNSPQTPQLNIDHLPSVLGTSAARVQLPTLVRAMSERGEEVSPVFVGAYNRPEVVLLPYASYARLTQLANLLEDIDIAQIVEERAQQRSALKPVSLEDLASSLGLSPKDYTDNEYPARTDSAPSPRVR